jgi:hypothetical protein
LAACAPAHLRQEDRLPAVGGVVEVEQEGGGRWLLELLVVLDAIAVRGDEATDAVPVPLGSAGLVAPKYPEILGE